MESNLIGVSICIAGNICVSLALNIQKLAHKRLYAQQHEHISHTAAKPKKSKSRIADFFSPDESSPLLPVSNRPTPPPANAQVAEQVDSQQEQDNHYLPSSYSDSPNAERSRYSISTSQQSPQVDDYPHDDGVNDNDVEPIQHPPLPKQNNNNNNTYLSSKLWWSGLALMGLGETGNFLSYGFAPASLVAPLGTVALMSNCLFAPLLLKERFRTRDLGGIILCLIGAVTVVYSSEGRNIHLDPDEFLVYISQPAFIVYTVICAVVASTLAIASRSKAGEKYIIIDLGLCAILGAFTVLSTKAIASFINLLFVKSLKYWVTYPTAAVLVITAALQIVYLNRALQRFDSKSVVPTQYVLFTISAIVGSAILYRDFEKVSFDKVLNFLLGCLTVFVGVYVLTTLSAADGPDREEDEHDSISNQRQESHRDDEPTTPIMRTMKIPIPPRTTSSTNITPSQSTGVTPNSTKTVPTSTPLSSHRNMARQKSMGVLTPAPKSAGYLLIANNSHDLSTNSETSSSPQKRSTVSGPSTSRRQSSGRRRSDAESHLQQSSRPSTQSANQNSNNDNAIYDSDENDHIHQHQRNR